MIDINNPLLKCYFDALDNVIPVPGGTGNVRFYEGEEPDNLTDSIYGVIQAVTSSDNSNYQLQKTITNIQVGIYSWANKYAGNSRLYCNQVAGGVLTIITPRTLNDLSAPGIKILTTKCERDIEQNLGEIDGRKYCNRILVFSHYIYT